MPIITPEKLAVIPDEPYTGIQYICELFDDFIEWADNNDEIGVKEYLEFWMLLKIFTRKHGLQFPELEQVPCEPNIYSQIRGVFSAIEMQAASKVREKELEEAEDYFAVHLGAGAVFELSEGDIAEINQKLSDLRTLISASESLAAKHKDRILQRLEKLQGEIHKKQSNYDRVLGTMIEVMAVVKKAGEAAEPWARVARDICTTICISQARVYELASSTDMNLLK